MAGNVIPRKWYPFNIFIRLIDLFEAEEVMVGRMVGPFYVRTTVKKKCFPHARFRFTICLFGQRNNVSSVVSGDE